MIDLATHSPIQFLALWTLDSSTSIQFIYPLRIIYVKNKTRRFGLGVFAVPEFLKMFSTTREDCQELN